MPKCIHCINPRLKLVCYNWLTLAALALKNFAKYVTASTSVAFLYRLAILLS